MKSILYLLLVLLIILTVPAYSADKNDPSAIASYLFNGSVLNTSGGGDKAITQKKQFTQGHKGTSNSAFSFEISRKNYNSSVKNVSFPIDINPDKFPTITITAWVKAENCFLKMIVIGNGFDKYARAIVIDKNDDQFRWGANCGKDGVLYGPPITDEWTFVAVIYDNKNQAARLVVNDKVYASRATSRNNPEKAFVGALNGAIENIQFFDKILSQAEIEALSGIPITENAADLEIKDRYSYREKRKQEEENKIKVGDIYIVDNKEFKVFDTCSQTNAIKVLTDGDTIFVTGKPADGWYKIGFKNNGKGFASRSHLLKDAYPQGGNSFIHKLAYEFSHIFDFTKLHSWIIVVVFTILLFFVKRYFLRLDSMLLRLRKGGDEFAGGGSKNDLDEHKTNFLNKIYPVKQFQWYPLLSGMLLGATIFIGSFWDTYEMEWFYNEGFNLLPTGYDRPVHWFLYAMSMITILLTLSWIVESFVVAGPWIGLLRILILFILNFMSLLVTFFLLVLVAIIIAVMIALWIFGSAAGSGSYKCPSCGRSFSASAGSSVSCPGCGASLST